MSYVYWCITLKVDPLQPYEPALTDGLVWLRGQQELGAGGYLHYQLVAAFERKVRLGGAKKPFRYDAHCEPSRSKAANDYVFKEDTAVPDTRFELGAPPALRNSAKRNWDEVWAKAADNRIMEIDSQTRIQYYSTLMRIGKDYIRPVGIVRTINVYWGAAGTGKSRLAWEEAGLDAYPKDPCTKSWDGYDGHKNVVIDEFRGDINISHFLRWCDRYPVIVDIKYGATPLKAETIWITSNVNPEDWYPDVNFDTKQALLRRLVIRHFE